MGTHSVLGFPCGSAGKESATMQETWVRSLGWEDALEKGKATHSSILAWRIPWGPWGHKELDTTGRFSLCAKCPGRHQSILSAVEPSEILFKIFFFNFFFCVGVGSMNSVVVV